MTLSPIGVVGFSLHQLRWLWPISAFVLAAILFGISRAAAGAATSQGAAARCNRGAVP